MAHARLVAVLGADTPADRLTLAEWQRFSRSRSAAGVRPRTVIRDLKFLRAALRWAVACGELTHDPLALAPLPKQGTIRRPRLAPSEYAALLRVAPAVGWRAHLALVLCHETGHRLKGVLHLRTSDLRDGGVCWREEHDKGRREHWTPLSEAAQDALRAALPHAAHGWLFPAPRNPRVPCSRHLAHSWWEWMATCAMLERVPGRGWHSLRRKFASEIPGSPAEIAVLGGWKSARTVVEIYQQADPAALAGLLAQRKGAV